jgi:methylated-DNA-protein-cysteine methyltransferase-like protein
LTSRRSESTDGFFPRVYALVRRIPRGQVMTYGQVAHLLGSPRAARAVGWALRALAGRASTVPWYRVLGQGGRISLPGLSGQRQRRKLAAEGVTFRGGRVDMPQHAALWAQARPGGRTRASTKGRQ